MADRQQLHELIEQLPASELEAALRYLRFLWYESQEEEPIDAETAAKLDAARAEGGTPVSLEEIERRDRITVRSGTSTRSTNCRDRGIGT